MGKVSKVKNDWLSKLESWEEREKDEDIRRMASVIRELVGIIENVPHTHIVSECWKCRMFDDLDISPDAKELLE